jgi:hypothetical protein
VVSASSSVSPRAATGAQHTAGGPSSTAICRRVTRPQFLDPAKSIAIHRDPSM